MIRVKFRGAQSAAQSHSPDIRDNGATGKVAWNCGQAPQPLMVLKRVPDLSGKESAARF